MLEPSENVINQFIYITEITITKFFLQKKDYFIIIFIIF